jgi:hypothetical protein
MSMDYTLTVDDPIGAVESSSSSLTNDQQTQQNNPILLTIVQYYDKGAKMWKEMDCVSESVGTTQKAGQCRFGNGNSVAMTVAGWLKAAGISDLNAPNNNANVVTNAKTTYDSQNLLSAPSYRVTGVDMKVQLEILDAAFTAILDWEDPKDNTAKKFTGLATFMKVQSSDLANASERSDYANFSEAGTAATNATVNTGKIRKRQMRGISIDFVNSPNSKRAYATLLAAVMYGAVAAVYFNFVTMGVMAFSLYLLGNTSRNYVRCLREQCNVAVQAARRTPAKAIVAAVAFWLMREWEHDHAAMHKFLDDTTVVHRDTFLKFLMCCYNPDLLPDIEPHEVEEMCEAAWSEMSGGEGSGLSLIEFCDCFCSSEVVDYLATRRAFDHTRKHGFLENAFGDAMSSYERKNSRVCFGLVENPGAAYGQEDREFKKKRNEKMRAALGDVTGLLGSGAGAGLAAGKALGNLGMGAGKALGGMGMKGIQAGMTGGMAGMKAGMNAGAGAIGAKKAAAGGDDASKGGTA